MNKILFIAMISWVWMSCQTPSSPKQPAEGDSVAGVPPPASPKPAPPADSLLLKLGTGKSISVVPGRSVGSLHIKEEDSVVFNVLGRADSGDAAMCKSWAMWYDNPANPAGEVDIFSECDPDVDMRKTIQQVRLAGLDFTTSNGLNAQSSYADIRKAHPQAVILGRFNTPREGTVVLLDDVEAGIAFAIKSANVDPPGNALCSSIVVHVPGKKATETYLPFYQPAGH
jgi:hypothetical protein